MRNVFMPPKNECSEISVTGIIDAVVTPASPLARMAKSEGCLEDIAQMYTMPEAQPYDYTGLQIHQRGAPISARGS